MIEITVKNYLSGALGVPVVLEEPEDVPERYVRVEKTGSSVNNRIYSAMIAVQSYGGSLYEAALLNERVKEAMEDLAGLDAVAGCHLNSDYNFTDTATHRHRYQAVFDITHY